MREYELGKGVAVIRTSDRNSFRRCRRKWNWSSQLRQFLGQDAGSSPLWVGTGFHYALEDYHGYRNYGLATTAFEAYVRACRATPGLSLPPNWQEDTELALAMLRYYEEKWLPKRDPLKTHSYNGRPACELHFQIDVPYESPHYDKVVYAGTFDRIIIDEDGFIWIVEYKTAKDFRFTHFDTDPQISAYCWAASCLFKEPVAGVIYQQHKKTVEREPDWLASGRFSTNKTQKVTFEEYRAALINVYGQLEKAPQDNRDFLNWLSTQESEEGDALIKRHFIQRNEHEIQAEGEKILLELEDMLNPDLPLYPNPTQDCFWDCDFKIPCLALDEGSDWEYELDNYTHNRKDEPRWQEHLPQPNQL